MISGWKRVAATSLVGVLILAGCSGGAKQPEDSGKKDPGATAPTQEAPKEPKKGGTLTVGMSANPRNIDPRLQWDSNSQIVHNNMVERLFIVGADGKLKPMLAESFTASPDGKQYTIKLRQGVTFHDGTPVTAGAIKLNIEWAADPEHKSPQVTMWDPLESVEAPDDQTLVINLKSPVSEPSFLGDLLDSPWPISASQIEANGADAIKDPLGAGPFKFVSYTGDDQIVMERNDAYWAGAPLLDKVVYRVIPDAATRRVEMEAGTIDVLLDVSPKDVAGYEAKGMTVISGPAPTSNMISLNVARGPLQELNVRKAIAYAINRDAIIDKIFFGYATKTNTFQHPENVNYDASLPGYDFNIDKAKELLDQAGWKAGSDGIRVKNGERLKLEIGARNHDMWTLMSQVLADQLKAIGIETVITTTDTSAFYNSVRGGTYDIAYWALNGSSWDELGHPNLRSTDWGNIAHLSKSSAELQAIQVQMDGMIDGFDQSLKAEDRKRYAQELQKTVHDNVIIVPLWFEDRIYVIQSYVKGIEAPTVVRNIRLENAWLDK